MWRHFAGDSWRCNFHEWVEISAFNEDSFIYSGQYHSDKANDISALLTAF